MSAPRILMLNQVAGPLTWELAEALAHALGPCAVLTDRPDELARPESVRIAFHRAPAYRRQNLWARGCSWSLYLVAALWWVLVRPRTCHLVLFSNPPLLPALGWLMRQARGQRYSVVVFDAYPDVLTQLGMISPTGLIARLWEWLNRRSYEAAELVITLSEGMAQTLRRQFNPGRTLAGKIEIIYPWVDTEAVQPIDKEHNWFAEKYALADKLTLLYSGNMGDSHDIETIIAAARILLDSPSVQFLFIGGGAKLDFVQDAIQRFGLINVAMLPWQPYSVLPYSMAAADVGVVSQAAGIDATSIPSKACYMMAAGLAMIGISDWGSDLSGIITRGNCGESVQPGDVPSFVAAVLRLLDNPDLLSSRKRAARCIAEEYFSKHRNVLRIQTALERVL